MSTTDPAILYCERTGHPPGFVPAKPDREGGKCCMRFCENWTERFCSNNCSNFVCRECSEEVCRQCEKKGECNG